MATFEPDVVIDEGRYYGWDYHDYQWSQGELVILRKDDHNGDQMQLNIWCSTGTIGSYLNHPRQRKTQLFRRDIYDFSDLRIILNNPRVHGYDGYHTRDQQRQPRQEEFEQDYGYGDQHDDGKNWSCPSCGKRFAKEQGMMSHIEQRPQCQQALTFNTGYATTEPAVGYAPTAIAVDYESDYSDSW